jgi:hypothetical protein
MFRKQVAFLIRLSSATNRLVPATRCIVPETVKTRLHRGRRLLRHEMEKHIGPVLGDAFPFAGRRCERLTEDVLERLGLN